MRRPFILDTFFVIFVEDKKSNTQLSPVTNGKCCETTCWDVKRLQAFTLNSCNRNVMAEVMGGDSARSERCRDVGRQDAGRASGSLGVNGGTHSCPHETGSPRTDADAGPMRNFNTHQQVFFLDAIRFKYCKSVEQ